MTEIGHRWDTELITTKKTIVYVNTFEDQVLGLSPKLALNSVFTTMTLDPPASAS